CIRDDMFVERFDDVVMHQVRTVDDPIGIRIEGSFDEVIQVDKRDELATSGARHVFRGTSDQVWWEIEALIVLDHAQDHRTLQIINNRRTNTLDVQPMRSGPEHIIGYPMQPRPEVEPKVPTRLWLNEVDVAKANALHDSEPIVLCLRQHRLNSAVQTVC